MRSENDDNGITKTLQEQMDTGVRGEGVAPRPQIWAHRLVSCDRGFGPARRTARVRVKLQTDLQVKLQVKLRAQLQVELQLRAQENRRLNYKQH